MDARVIIYSENHTELEAIFDVAAGVGMVDLTSTTLPAFIFLLPGVFLLREWWGPPARGSRWDAAQLHRRAENAYRRTRKPAVAARRK